jgi:hypothetical protein
MTQDPIDLLIAFEEASVAPIRPEYVEGTVIVPPQPDYNHSNGAVNLTVQLTRPDPTWRGWAWALGPPTRTAARWRW